MRYDDCELRERLTSDFTADVGVVIHNGQAAEDKGRFIIRDIQNHSAAGGAVNPESLACLVVPGKNQHMLPAFVAGEKSEIAGEKSCLFTKAISSSSVSGTAFPPSSEP